MEIKQNQFGWWQMKVGEKEMKKFPYFFKKAKRILPPFIITDEFQNFIDENGAMVGKGFDNEWFYVISFKEEIDLLTLRLKI